MYKVLIRPVLTYASEILTLSKINEGRLSLFERKVLRCIFGVKQENGTWLKWYNYELYETFNEPNIVTYIQVKRLAWAGHFVHMNNDRTLTRIGVTSVGRPKLWREDSIDQDIRISGVKNWKKVALNRDKRAKLLKKATAHQGLSRNDDDDGDNSFSYIVHHLFWKQVVFKLFLGIRKISSQKRYMECMDQGSSNKLHTALYY
jgi:hypothetical protein